MSSRNDDLAKLAGTAVLPATLVFFVARGWPTTANLVFVYAPIAIWSLTLAATQAMWTLRPTHYPRLRALAETPRRLRSAPVRAMVSALEHVGFVVIGPKSERTFFLDFPSLELWHPEHRTFASISPIIGAPRVSFISASRDGTILYSGIGGVPARRDRVLTCRVGVGRAPAERFADHLAALALEKCVAAGPASDGEPSREALLAHRFAITRRWYVARFGTDAQWSSYDAAQTAFARAVTAA